MRLYIANASHHSWVINYRLPESSGVMMQSIEMASQVLVGGEHLSSLQIESVIKQLRPYGLRAADEVKGDGLIPLVFSRDKPVQLGIITDCIARNRGVLRHKGEETRAKAAIAADQRASSLLDQAPELRSNLQMMEMSVQEETPGTMEQDGKPINDGFRINHDANDPSTRFKSPPRRSRKGRASAVQ